MMIVISKAYNKYVKRLHIVKRYENANTLLMPGTGNGTFDFRNGTAAKSTSTMEKRQSVRALQQRIQPKREISQVLQVGLATVNRDI